MNTDKIKQYLSIAEDGGPFSLELHDKKYHPNGYNDGDPCKVRERMAEGDSSDYSLMKAQKEEKKETANPSENAPLKTIKEVEQMPGGPDKVKAACAIVPKTKEEYTNLRYLLESFEEDNEDWYSRNEQEYDDMIYNRLHELKKQWKSIKINAHDLIGLLKKYGVSDTQIQNELDSFMRG